MLLGWRGVPSSSFGCCLAFININPPGSAVLRSGGVVTSLSKLSAAAHGAKSTDQWSRGGGANELLEELMERERECLREWD